MRHIVFLGVMAIFVPSLSPASDQLDSSVYQCPGPSGGALYTNQKRPGCEVMNLPELTIAPDRDAIQSNNTTPYGLRPFPSDWFDYTGQSVHCGTVWHREGCTACKIGLITMRRLARCVIRQPIGQILTDSTDGEKGKEAGTF